MKGYIFDFDGVVIDTEKYHFLAWKEVFSGLGYEFDDIEYEPLKSTGRRNIIAHLEKRENLQLTDGQVAKICIKKGECYENLVKGLSIEDAVPGVLEYLDFLKASGGKIAVASSSMSAGKIAKMFEIENKFDNIVDGNSLLPQKPNPDIFLKAVSNLSLSPEDCVVFEDSISGVIASGRAGIKCVHIGKTTHPLAVENIQDFVGYKRTEF